VVVGVLLTSMVYIIQETHCAAAAGAAVAAAAAAAAVAGDLPSLPTHYAI